MNISLHLYTGESGLTNLSFHLHFLLILPFLMKTDSKGLYPTWNSYSKNMYQFHCSHHHVSGTTLTGWMQLCRFRHKTIHNEVAVGKHTDTTTQHIIIYWAEKNQTLETVIKATPEKTVIWPSMQGSNKRILTPVTGVWSLFTLAAILHTKVHDWADKCLQW